jgi:hypothetical protein
LKQNGQHRNFLAIVTDAGRVRRQDVSYIETVLKAVNDKELEHCIIVSTAYIFTERDGRKGPPAGNKARCNRTFYIPLTDALFEDDDNMAKLMSAQVRVSSTPDLRTTLDSFNLDSQAV